MEKGKSDREKKEKEAKEKKYNEALQKAEDLEKEGKYKEAWPALPKVSEYPDFADNNIAKNKTNMKDILLQVFLRKIHLIVWLKIKKITKY